MTGPLHPDTPRENMLDKAWRRVSQALDTGRSIEAVRWLRIHAMLLETERTEGRARDPDSADRRRPPSRNARDGEAQAVAALGRIQAENPFLTREVHTVHSKKSTTAPSALPDPDEPGLSRAERRRRLKYRARSP
ncbi:hypothetical protein [Brevundimonas sp.]|uniref:hypothetical protein n=1 Tax=Brevundimonas sp. TaxID=1871086 RepID=UPI003564949D